MKVLYCNPVFLEYRLPFYEKLVKLFDGEFYIMYSPNRYKVLGKEKFCKNIKEKLGRNAEPFENDHLFDTNSKSIDYMPDISKGKRLPIFWGLMNAIRKINPDVLITEGYFQWTPIVQLYGKLHNVPVFMGYERTLWTERNNGKLKTFIRRFQNRLFEGFLVNGSETKKYLMSIGVKEEKIHIGGMSADSEGLRKGIASMSEEEKSMFRAKFAKGRGLVYLFCGRVENLKGTPHLLEAWEEHIKVHPDDHIILVGYGDKSEEMKAKYKDVASVHLEGRVPYTEVHKYYAVADVFILPTLTDNWSLVVPEAMACGLPVATSIYNGCHPELVHEGENGYVFDTLDKDSMIKTLDYFHHVDLKAFGQRSIELEKEFNTENSAKREYEGICSAIQQRKL